MSNTLRLSEAIRLGAVLRPQAFNVLFDKKGTCTFGAALEAIGWKPEIDTQLPWCDDRWRRVFPVQDGQAFHPLSGRKMTISTIVVELNNHYRWSRERIADWVESIEKQQEVAVETRELAQVSQ